MHQPHTTRLETHSHDAVGKYKEHFIYAHGQVGPYIAVQILLAINQAAFHIKTRHI